MSNLIQQSQPPQVEVDQIIGLYNQGQLEQTASLAESLAGQYPNTLLLYDTGRTSRMLLDTHCPMSILFFDFCRHQSDWHVL